MNGKAAGNVLVSAGILFTGASPTSVLRTLEHINIQVFTLRTFYNYQRGYLLPAINKVKSKAVHSYGLFVLPR